MIPPSIFIIESKPQEPKAEKPKSFRDTLLENFSSIFAAISAAITGVISYWAVTMHNQQVELANLQLKTVQTYTELSFKREALNLDAQKADLDRRRSSLDSAKAAETYVPKLLNNDRDVVESAAAALAVAGMANVDILVSAVGNERLTNLPSLIYGLQIIAAQDHVMVCNRLCANGKISSTEKGQAHYAEALGSLRCAAAKDLVAKWKGTNGHPSIDVGLAQLTKLSAPATKDLYGNCKADL